MKTVAIARLKSRLSQYIREVERGEEIAVTSHRQHVATLVRAGGGTGPAIRPSKGKWSDLKDFRGVKPLKPFDPVEALLADRAKR